MNAKKTATTKQASSTAKKKAPAKASKKAPVRKTATASSAAKKKPAAKKATATSVATKKTAVKKTVRKAAPKEDTLPESITLAAGVLFLLRAENVQLLDLRGINDVADYFLIGTCTSEAQMQAILNELTKEFKAQHIGTNGFEYKSGVQWAVFDAGLDLMVHLFEENKRQELALDILYRDGKVKQLDEKDFVKGTASKTADTHDFI